MNRSHPFTAWRGGALAVALFAITLNFLQPLAHGALFRLGTPQALWSVLCNSGAADPARSNGSPSPASHDHECCLGLAHATPLVAPSAEFILVERFATVASFRPAIELPTAGGIRDGPSQPRGPPSLA